PAGRWTPGGPPRATLGSSPPPPLRILITTPVFPPDLGGPAVYVPSVGRFLAARGHQVKVVAFCSDPRPSGYPFEVVSILPAPMLLRYLRAFFVVLRHARECDVVYVNEHLALLHVLAARLRGRPVIIRMMVDGAWEISHRKGWIGGDTIDEFQKKDYGWRVALMRRLQKRWWGSARRVIACSNYLRGIAMTSYGQSADKVRLIHNAYNGPAPDSVRETPSEARAKLGLAEGPRYLLTICRLMVWKRVDGIILALKSLPDDVELLVAGDGDMLEPWKRCATELGLEKRVHFLGNRPYAEIPLLIRASEIFVLNSTYEGLSHTLLEVCALGTPAVATDIGGNPEVIEDGVNGLLVHPGDPTELSRAIGRLLGDRELQRRFREASILRMARFSVEATFSEVEATLSEACSA
ncbi:MAG: glycosyltransferase family 4 protein, partial [Planctomycetota bacterium]